MFKCSVDAEIFTLMTRGVLDLTARRGWSGMHSRYLDKGESKQLNSVAGMP